MGNIDTYVRETGQKTFEELPFNDVDNLIISYLVYYDFRKIVPTPGQNRSITIGRAAQKYKETIGDTQVNVRSVLLEDMGASARFAPLKLSDRIDIFHKNGTQFSGLCVNLPDGTPYFVFRGVDTSITGWREAFETSYMETPAQKMAARYVQRIIDKHLSSGKILFGGHSKGGNLAAYAAVHLEKKYRDRVVKIYQNDSPGLQPGSYDKAILKEYDDRIWRLAPEYSVVDCVFKNSPPNRVVKVDAKGFVQHEPFFWIVNETDFVDGTADPDALKYQRMLKKWIGSMQPEESRQFVRRFFDILQQKIDEGRNVDFSKVKEIIGLVLESWTGAGKPAKRAMLRFAQAAVDAEIVTKLRPVKKKTAEE